MAVLSDARILEAIYDKKIQLTPFVYEHIQPSSIDLTLSAVIKKLKKEYEGRSINPLYPQDDWYEQIEASDYELQPNELVLGTLNEEIGLPTDIFGEIKNRTSLLRMGIDSAHNAIIQPGYKGKLTLPIKNLSSAAIKLASGIRICQLVLHDVRPNAKNAYGSNADAKYYGELGGKVSNIHLDRELIEYLKNNDGKELSDFLLNRLREKESFNFQSLTHEQKKELGLI